MPTVKNDPAPNVSNATVEKPSSSLCVVGGKRWGRALLFWPFSNLRWSLMLLSPVSSACLLLYLFHCPLSFLAKRAPWLPSSGPGCWQCMPSLSRALWFCSILRFCLFQSLSLLVWKQPVCSLPLSFEGSQALITCVWTLFSSLWCSPLHPCPLPNGLCLDILNILIFPTSAREKLMPQKSVLLPRSHPAYLHKLDSSCPGYLPWICTGCKFPHLWIELIVFLCLFA